MLKLPLWLDLGSCRVVHAAWDDCKSPVSVEPEIPRQGETLPKLGKRQTREGRAVDWLLKGPEDKLGDGALLADKDGFGRNSVRANGGFSIRPGMTHAEAAMPAVKFAAKEASLRVSPSRDTIKGASGIFWPLLVGSRKGQGSFSLKRRMPGLQRRLRRTAGRLSVRRRANPEP